MRLAMPSEERLPHCRMTRTEIADWVADSRTAQGLPPRIEDRAALTKIATILLSIPATPTPVSDTGARSRAQHPTMPPHVESA